MAQFAEIVIDQGVDFSEILTLTDDTTGAAMNIVGFTITSNAKTSYVSPNVAFSFVCVVNDAANGNVGLTLAGTVSANVLPKSYVFDVKVKNPANVTSRLIQGLVTVDPAVT